MEFILHIPADFPWMIVEFQWLNLIPNAENVLQ